MDYKNIKINDLELGISTGQPTSFTGRRYRQPMAGIDLKFSVWGGEKKKDVEDIFTGNGVTVEDPFTHRTYQAKGKITFSSSQKGESLHHYHHYEVKLVELETVPEVKTLEIQGHNFKVVHYREHNLTKRPGFSMTALLQLTPEEFVQLRGLQSLESVNVRRIGTDKQPVALFWGQGLHWSKHENADGQYINQVVKLFPLEMLPTASDVAELTMRDEILNRVTLALSIRFQALLTQLVASKTITQDQAAKIMQEQSKDLLDPTIYNDVLLEQDRVTDAGALLA